MTGVTKSRGPGPGALAGSRGAREDQITRIKWGPAKAKSHALKGLRKVEYGRVQVLSLSELWPVDGQDKAISQFLLWPRGS
jgi:hypothetical protein